MRGWIWRLAAAGRQFTADLGERTGQGGLRAPETAMHRSARRSRDTLAIADQVRVHEGLSCGQAQSGIRPGRGLVGERWSGCLLFDAAGDGLQGADGGLDVG